MDKKNEHIIAKWLEGSLLDENLDSQFDAKMSDDLRLIKDATDQLSIPEIDSTTLLDKIKADISQPKTTKVLKLKYWISGIAALLIAIVAYTGLLDGGITVQNDSLVYLTHNLPDGSIITLNANSEIEYDSDFANNRILNLSGEAFFEVKKGETFRVYTDNGDVTVLGTSFNVFSRDKSFNVACKTGKVKVNADDEYILNPGENVVAIDGSIMKNIEVEVKQIGAWQFGESKFKSTPLDEVILALEAQYNVVVEGQLLDRNQKFTGSFVHDDLDKAIRMVFLPMGVSYDLDQKNKIITIQ